MKVDSSYLQGSTRWVLYSSGPYAVSSILVAGCTAVTVPSSWRLNIPHPEDLPRLDGVVMRWAHEENDFSAAESDGACVEPRPGTVTSPFESQLGEERYLVYEIFPYQLLARGNRSVSFFPIVMKIHHDRQFRRAAA